MKILHIACINGSKYSGVCVVVPEHIKAQSKIAEVRFINISGVKIDGLEQQIELPSNNALTFEVIAKILCQILSYFMKHTDFHI